jgi:hypothetical protein
VPYKPIQNVTATVPPLESRGNRPLQMSFEEHLKVPIFFHLEEHTSAQRLLQAREPVCHPDRGQACGRLQNVYAKT